MGFYVLGLTNTWGNKNVEYVEYVGLGVLPFGPYVPIDANSFQNKYVEYVEYVGYVGYGLCGHAI